MDSLQLLNRISPEGQKLVFSDISTPGKIGPRRAAQLQAQRYRIKKRSQDSLTVSLLRSSINKEPCNHVRVCREQAQYLDMCGQENTFQRNLDRSGQPLQTIGDFCGDLNLNSHDFASVGVGLGE